MGVVGVSVLLVSSMVLAEGKPAKAADHAAKYHEQFAKLDTNHDGVIDKGEAKAHKALHKSFAKAAKDGKMTEEQFAKWSSSHTKGAGKPKS